MKLYVASTWRNDRQPRVVQALRDDGHEVYDFRHPPGGDHLAFSWSDVDPGWRSWTTDQYVAALEDPIAVAGFESDYSAMVDADACVLVLPSGRSAHLEAGWFIGQDKPVVILLDPLEFVPGAGAADLMYKMADVIVSSIDEARRFLDDISIPMEASS